MLRAPLSEICYVCRAVIKGYGHFGNPADGKCPQNYVRRMPHRFFHHTFSCVVLRVNYYELIA